ncbi:MAG: Outer rane porin precursor [Pseudomonadota bacterium]|jgi:OOP family OmpA-OmpF porin
MKLTKVAMLLATLTITATASAQNVDNWRNAGGDAWMSGTGLCWRDANWTPATAAKGCDGAIAPAPAMAPKAAMAPAPAAAAPMAPKAAAAPAPAASAAAPRPAAPPAPPAAVKVTYAADAFFDTGKSVVKADGKAKLDDLATKVKGINLEVIIAVGHTDSVGADALNQKLSVSRAEAVKAYLVSKGIEKNRVYTEGKGSKQPVADNKTTEGKTKNRRVEIEVVGTRANK